MSVSLFIVTPNSFLARNLTQALPSRNWNVRTASSATQAMKELAKSNPDLILLDPEFEDVKPTVLCRAVSQAVRKLKGRSVPVMFYGKGTRDDIIAALKAGADDYIVKPAKLETLVSKLEGALEKAGIRSEESGSRAERKERSPFRPDMDPKAKVRALLQRARALKTIPATVSRTLAIADDPTTGADDLAKVIQADAAVAAAVLRRANTAYQAAGNPIVDLKTALVRLGFEETKSLVVGLRVVKLFGTENRNSGFTRMGFWEHSLAVGLLAMHIARLSGRCDTTYAFVGGLLHDVGKLLMDEQLPVDFAKALAFTIQKGVSLAAAEREIFGFTHNEVGEAVMQRWRLPEEIRAAVLLHNRGFEEIEEDTGEKTFPLVKLVKICNALAKALRFGVAGDRILEELDEEKLREFKITEEAVEELATKIDADIKEFQEFLKMPSEGMSEQDECFGDETSEIVYRRSSKVSFSPVRLFLKRSGRMVHSVSGLKEIMDVLADKERNISAFIAEVENDSELSELAAIDDSLSGLKPVFIMNRGEGESPDASRFPASQAEILTRPLDARLLLQALEEKVTRKQAEPAP